MADFHLIDVAGRNNNYVSSRLDLILTNLPINNPKYSTTITIFDHAWVRDLLGKKEKKTTPTMKDYVIGSKEFLIKYFELPEGKLATCILLHNQNDSRRTLTTTSPMPSHLPHNQLLSRTSTPETSQHEPGLKIYYHKEDIDPTRKPMETHGNSAHDLKSGQTVLQVHFMCLTELFRSSRPSLAHPR